MQQQVRDDDDGLRDERNDSVRISFRRSADQVPLPFSFRRGDRLRSSLPVVGATNKSMEQPLGEWMVFRFKHLVIMMKDYLIWSFDKYN